MVNRDMRAKTNPLDNDALVICQVCGENLITTKDGISYCPKCSYYCRTIPPMPEDYSIHCMVCGVAIESGQMCDECNKKMMDVYNQLNSSKK